MKIYAVVVVNVNVVVNVPVCVTSIVEFEVKLELIVKVGLTVGIVVVGCDVGDVPFISIISKQSSLMVVPRVSK